MLASYPPLRERVGGLVRSIENAVKEGSYPWVRLESSAYAEYVAELIARVSGKMAVGQVFQSDFDVEELTLEVLDEAISRDVWKIQKGDRYDAVIAQISESGLERVKRVWSPSEFNVMGDSMTLWPKGFEKPFRLEFEDDLVVRIGFLDVEVWKVVTDVLEVTIPRNVDSGNTKGLDGGVEKLYGGFTEVIGGEELEYGEKLPFFIGETGILPPGILGKVAVIDFEMRPVRWDEGIVRSRIENGWNVWVVTDERGDRVDRILDELDGSVWVDHSIDRGFEYVEGKLMVLSDYELWGSVKLGSSGGRGTFSDLVLDSIEPGDFVVHEDHGVGVFAGISEKERDGDMKEYIEIAYAEKDKLFVPLDQLKRVTKYVGVGGRVPKLTRLGGGEWRRVKNRVKKAVRELAGELLRLYAVRELAEVEPFSDGILDIGSFEEDFEYTETGDQLAAVEDIKQDLRGDTPMDRILVGDVGFGKTEVAMRAAYMIVNSGQQVAVLAPTTILVEQHYRVFCDRFSKYGVKVESLSRFLTKEQADDVVSRVAKGDVDVVIGTHRLLSKDISFRNIGLVIIDEEQKFGVSQKEKLKNMRVDTHVLSMSATPIPRTLNMALTGVRDVSIIAAPPEGRIPVKNVVQKFDWDMVTEAIKKEVSRGGQVYFVHNRVSTIGVVAQKMSELIPGVRIVVGHGQMAPSQLSRVMREFHEGKHDVLLCTTIIENGLDMPNVNTLIVDRAEMYGLGQLYQIRGRIGRGTREGFAYFLYYGSIGGRFVKQGIVEREKKHLEEDGEIEGEGDSENLSNRILWEDARARLDAVRQLEALGSGFALAQRDLEIRGAGNFLGREQHGNVASVGFSLYCRLLDEMIKELRKSGSDKVKLGKDRIK